MKTKTLFKVIIVSAVALTLLFFAGRRLSEPRKTESGKQGSEMKSAAQNLGVLQEKPMEMSSSANSGNKAFRPERKSSAFISSEVVVTLGLTADECAVLDQICLASRQKVMQRFADAAKIRRIDASTIQMMVVVPKIVAGELREELYASVADIIGVNRLEQFKHAENISRFEAQLEFLGAFPMAYTFTGDGSTLAESTSVAFNSTVERTDAAGPYISYAGGELSIDSFRNRYGVLADMALLAKN